MRSIRAAETTVGDLVAAHARRAPVAPAILAPGRPALGFRELVDQMEHAEAYLASVGLGRGKRVAIALAEGPEMATALLSIMNSATCIPLNPAMELSRARALLLRAHADALILGESDTDSPLTRAAREMGLPTLVLRAVSHEPAGTFTLHSTMPRCETIRARPTEEDVALLVATSGTTGVPKLVPIRHKNLTMPAVARARRLALSPIDRALCVVPLFTTSGIRRALLPPLAAGGSVICAPRFSDDEFSEWIETLNPTFFAAGPAVIEAALAVLLRGSARRALPLRFILSGSTALHPERQTAIEHALGVPVIQGLASAETGVIAQNPLPPGRRVPGSVGIPMGCELRIVDEAGVPVAPGTIGEILVRGPEVFDGYEADAGANNEAFRDGWFRTGDIGHIDGNGYLFLTGRRKEIVNRGGFKVSPSEVDTVLMQHPAVRDAATFGVPHKTLGEDLVSAVVLHESEPTPPQAIRDFAMERLSPYQVPTSIRIVQIIPRNALGKVLRNELAQTLGDGPPSESLPPANAVEQFVVNAFSEVLDQSCCDRSANFFAMGGNSLQVSRVVARVNAAFGTDLTPLDLFRRPTVEAFAALIEGRAHANRDTSRPPLERRRRISTDRSSLRGTGEPS